MARLPNAEMALIQWIRAIPEIPPNKVATTLPADVDLWKDTGFIQVMAVGGEAGVYVPMRSPVLQVSAWAVAKNSLKTPWHQAQDLAEKVFAGFYNADLFPLDVTFGSSDYMPARVLTGFPLVEPRKIPGSESNYAQVQFDCTLRWVTP